MTDDARLTIRWKFSGFSGDDINHGSDIYVLSERDLPLRNQL